MSVRVIGLADAAAHATRVNLLGGKGAGLAVMAGLGLPVPPAFVVTTAVGREFLQSGRLAADVLAGIRDGVRGLERETGRRVGDPAAPLLLSVRSGAAVSMPGMMDTVLDIGALPADPTAPAPSRFERDTRRRFVRSYATAVGGAIPDDPFEQVEAAVLAVLASWHSPRAHTYRQLHDIADDLGTAVVVQAMVFGNRDEQSATGVAFSRDPNTGAAEPYGDVLFTAQGDDVVAGGQATQRLDVLAARLPDVWAELLAAMAMLERHIHDACYLEFTVESGQLWLLQLRAAGAQPTAAPVAAGPATPSEVLTTGLGASQGAATGRIVTTSEEAVRLAEVGPVILVRPVTSPMDLHGIAAATGILTSTGGLASHAAVVARSLQKPAVVGASDVTIDPTAGTVTIGDVVLHSGDLLTIDGTAGTVSVAAHGDRMAHDPAGSWSGARPSM